MIARGEVQLGIVYDPNRDECYSARLGEGARLNDEALAVYFHDWN